MWLACPFAWLAVSVYMYMYVCMSPLIQMCGIYTCIHVYACLYVLCTYFSFSSPSLFHPLELCGDDQCISLCASPHSPR